MDWVVALVLILVVLWALGLSFASSVGSLIHLLLVIAVILIVVRLVKGQSL
ncbi:lmo0937 family membrane protein [Candidatus Micrarchaeota archaeon]|nr:lmo0937 family membrane protein [Candidatus Micrarchaeota archaeon]